MAAVAAMRTLFTRIGFTLAAAQAIVDEQNLDSLAEVKLLTDDEIESLCKVLHRPGGTVPGALAGVLVPNPGIPVNLRAENQVKLLAFFLRHQERVSRTVQPPDITLDMIRRFRELRDFRSTYKATTHDAPTINAKDWPKTMESIHEFLRSYVGDHKVTLAYHVRKDDSVPTEDPPGGYATVQDEMIARDKHYTLDAAGNKIPDSVYITNREKVWEIIAKITRDLPCWRT